MGAVSVVVVRRHSLARRAPLAVLGHGEDVAGAGLHHCDRRGAPTFVINGNCAGDGVEGSPLRLWPQCGADGIAAATQEGFTGLWGISEGEVGADRLEDVVTEERCVRGGAAVRYCRGLDENLHRNERGLCCLTLRDVAELSHARKHDISPLRTAFGISDGIEGRRLLDDACKRGRLGERQFGGCFREVSFGCGFNSVGT